METYAIGFYLYCDWKDLPPTYRIYFDGELMTERTYIWVNDKHVLEERLPVIADPNIPHTIKIEPVGPRSGSFRIERIVSKPSGLGIIAEIA